MKKIILLLTVMLATVAFTFSVEAQIGGMAPIGDGTYCTTSGGTCVGVDVFTDPHGETRVRYEYNGEKKVVAGTKAGTDKVSDAEEWTTHDGTKIRIKSGRVQLKRPGGKGWFSLGHGYCIGLLEENEPQYFPIIELDR